VAESTTQHQERTQLHPPQDPSGRARLGALGRRPGLVALLAGAAGVVAAVLPSVGGVAIVLAAVAIGIGVPVMRRGPGDACFPCARTGVVLGMIAVPLGVVSVAMQLLA
jgi:hypothetical protein